MDKRLSITIPSGLVPWVTYAAALDDDSLNAYVLHAIYADRDSSTGAKRDGYRYFLYSYLTKHPEYIEDDEVEDMLEGFGLIYMKFDDNGPVTDENDSLVYCDMQTNERVNVEKEYPEFVALFDSHTAE